MKKGIIQRLLPHSIAIVLFLLVAVIYCKPVFDGKVLQQNDVTQWRAMAQNSFKYKEAHGHFPLWTNGMFSGMPAYQIAMESQNAISPGIFYSILTLGLPKPISLFFLACISFYFLSQVVKVNPYIGIIGALAFAYATYNPVIVAAGHDTKMQTIALMPAFIGSLLLVYDKKYWAGGALTALSSSLLVGMNHPQIAYYTFLIAIAMTIAFVINRVRQKEVKHLLISGAIVIVAGLIGVLSNAVTLFTTYEYAKESIRGGSELADNKTNSTKTGLSADYALSYSFAKAEPFVMMAPNLFGGSTAPIEEKLETSKAMESLQAMPPELGNQIAGFRLAYWGGIVESAGTSGPPYVGAIICFLTLLGFFILDNKHKWWILAVTALAIMMSWGHYFAGFNHFLLKSLPMYNKFRAPSMTLVIPAFLFCLMSILTLQAIVSMENKDELWKRFKKGLILSGGVILVLLMLYFTADYRSESDRQLLAQSAGAPEQVKGYITDFTNALRDDRQSLFFSSLLRSFLFMAAAAFILWLSIRRKIKAPVVFALVGILSFIDIMSVSSKYLNSENYQDEIENQNSFTQTAADNQILQDTSYYRVLDLRQGLGTLTYGANTAFFHKSIGGYHPAKLSIYQDLIERQLMQFPQSLPVVNMLNTKYIIQADQSGKEQVYPNPDALGAAWFVKTIKYETTPAAVMNALSNFHPKDTAILFAGDRNLVTTLPAPDSSASIRLVKNDNDEVLYQASTATGGFAVFSEVFYSKGWKAFVDGKETPILRTNYVLRGLSIPAGNHEVRFSFHPDSYYTGDTVSLIAGLLVFAALIIALVMTFKKKNATAA